jgi:acetyl esterase/lipase
MLLLLTLLPPQMMAAGFKVGIRWGNLSTLRLMLGWMAQPALFPHLVVRQVQPPGCEPCYWLSLRSGPQDSAQPDIVLCYVHGGAFVAGHPLMCAATFGRWMRALASQGLHTNVLCVSYPLAPERPFPSAVASTAAAFAWVGQEFPAGCGTTVIAVGDSAGGNIVPAALHALRDYCQQPQPAARLLYTPGASSSSSPESAPAGEARAALSHQPSALVRSNSQAAALTAALEAHLFADLHNRLTVMAVTSMQASTSSSDAGPGEAAAVPASTVRMPSAVILVSPAADISPTASFRSRSLTSSSTSSSPTDAAVAGSSDVASISAAGGAAAVPAAGGTGGGTGSTTSSSSSSRIHYDYLPENIESGGMGSYAEHHEQLCGVFASPVHLPRLDGLCSGRWLVLSGGVELLHPDIERWAAC